MSPHPSLIMNKAHKKGRLACKNVGWGEGDINIQPNRQLRRNRPKIVNRCQTEGDKVRHRGIGDESRARAH